MDFSGIADAIRGFRENDRAKRADARANAYLDMEKEAVRQRSERESAALARQKEQDKFQRDVKAFEALPALYRAAHKSVGMANANPYGVKFDETMEAPDQGAADAEVGKFLAGDRAPEMMPPSSTSVPRQLLPSEEGPEQAPEAEAARFASTDSLMDSATTGQPMDLMAQAAANAMGPPTRRIQATYQGQRFDVPEQSDTLGLGPEYDAIYQNLLASGEDEDAARKYVLAEHKTDRTQKSIDARVESQIKAQGSKQEDQQRFLEEMAAQYRLTFEQRKQLAEILNRGRMAAAGATTSPFLPEVVRSVEEGAPLSETAALAAKHNIPSKAYTPLASAVVSNAGKANTAQNQRAELEVTDSKGNPLGTAHNTTQANQLKKQTDQFAQARVRLVELIDDIEKQGSRVLTPEDIQQRLSKAESVNAAMRVYNGLGATDASQALEARITGAIGTPGHGFLMGANADIIKRILHEAEMQHDSRVKTALRSGGGPRLAPALGGPRKQGDGAGMVTIRNKKTGETKQVTREEAQRMGAL